MSRPQKIHKPIKASFTQIINAVADGKGAPKKPAGRSVEAQRATPPPHKKS
jgi:hypothetical protein